MKKLEEYLVVSVRSANITHKAGTVRNVYLSTTRSQGEMSEIQTSVKVRRVVNA